jgi:uncharacterized protein YciI
LYNSAHADLQLKNFGAHMLFAVIFTDKPGLGSVRAEHLQRHVQWLAAHQDVVLVAGSLRAEVGAVPKGGLWIVEAASKAAVHELMKSDPFYTCGLRQDVEVLHWSKALENKVLV